MTYGSGNSGDYKKLKGQMIQVTDTDPLPYAGAWSSGGNLNQARYSIAGAGTQTAGLAFGGYSAPSRRDETEEYNGTAWTENGDLNMARNELTGAGTQTAALAAGGYSPSVPGATNDAETYNGSSWTEITNLSTARDGLGSTSVGAVNTAVIVVGGQPFSAAVEQWNGSSWTEITELNANKELNAGAGTVTSGITIGGKVSGPTITNQVETWDGSSWTEVSEINNARSRAGASGVSNTAALLYAGEDGPSPDFTGNTESWDGTSWTEVADMSTARYGLTGGGGAMPNATALASGGYINSSSGMTNTEEWSFPSAPGVLEGQMWIKTATGTSSVMKGYQAAGTGAFAAGGAIPAVKSAHGFAGTQTAGVAFAGATSTTNKVATSFEYNGTAWSDANDVNTTRDLCAGAGTQTAAILFGGTLPPGGHSNATELYDGTNWTVSPGTFSSQARSRIGPLGTQTAALAVSGTPISPVDQAVESWNGSSWTEIAEINTSRINGGAAGVQTAGLFFGGEDPLRALTESWDGTAWTEVGDMNTARQSSGMGAGIQTAAMAIGGEVSPGFTANSETYNGTSWTEVANLSTARGYHGCGGSQVLAISTGGRTPTFVANTEEWTVPLVTKTVGTD
jgi:hypothetical protein